MKRKQATLVVCLSLLLALPACASGGGGGATTLSVVAASPSGDFEAYDRGYGLEVTRHGSERPFQMGWGLAASHHRIADSGGTWFLDTFLEPRVAVGGRLQKVVPFVSGRVGGAVLYSYLDEIETVDPSTDVGFLYGGNGGVMVFLNRALSVEASLGIYRHSLFEADEEAGTVESSGSGGRTQLAVGLRWGR